MTATALVTALPAGCSIVVGNDDDFPRSAGAFIQVDEDRAP
ncbi:MAG TPA: hypothetical protein VGO95_09585 [Modestobacter sp.]|nr:hypothetical protein [Modestobacter sp.]